MTAVILALALLQGQPPEASATVDRTHVRVGEELLLTVRARSRAADPVRILIPPLGGFALVGSRDLTEVALSGGGRVRTTVREIRLRAEWPGRRVIPSIRVTQGERAVTVGPITVQVDSAVSGAAAGLSLLARALLDSAPPPDSVDRVSVSLVAPPRPVLAGQQVDVVAIAWFPRDLRLRLRRAPVVTLRTPDGVWAHPQAVPSDVALSRLVRGRWFDLFVAHQIVFPLQPGQVVVPPARVDFALPVTYSFFSREDRYSFQSDSAVIAVVAPPAAGRPADDRGVVATDLGLHVAVSDSDARAGEPLDVAATITGTGNVDLWPEPALRWPRGFRAYPAQSVTQVEPYDGRVAGTKTFEYLVVPDSAGAFVFGEVRYPYYDVGGRQYRVARSPARTVAVAVGAEPRAARVLPPLAEPRPSSGAERLAARLFPLGWAALLIAPPLLALLVRRRSAAGRARGEGDAGVRGRDGPARPLAVAEREFQAVLASHVPDPVLRDGPGLAQALRAAGVDGPVAEHVMRLRDRLQAVRFGPRGAGDSAELAAEIRQVLRFLNGEPGRRRAGRTGVALLVALAAAVPARAAAQAPGAEALYEAGALRAAADSFAARAERDPAVSAHWYNLGATRYRAGSDGEAIAAWTRAARLAPRDPLIRRARLLLPPPDATSDPLLAVGPATPGEWALAAGVCWLALWLAVLRRSRLATLAVLAGLVAATAIPGWTEWRRRTRPVAVVLQPATVVRGAPFGGAPALGSLEAGAAVVLARTYGAWIEVQRPDGTHGWVLASEVARL